MIPKTTSTTAWAATSALTLTRLRRTFLFAALGFLHWEEHAFVGQRHHSSVSQGDDGEAPEVSQDGLCVSVAVLHGAEVADQQPGELMQTAT